MTNQTITDDGSINKIASIIPHMADDDLDPFQMRLYIHYKKMFALHGECDESVRETAKATHMNTKTVTKAREGLAALGYIKQDKPTPAEARKGKTVHVLLIDLWQENLNRYAKAVSQVTQEAVVDLPQVNEKAVVDLLHPVVDLPQLLPENGAQAVVDLLRRDSLKDKRESLPTFSSRKLRYWPLEWIEVYWELHSEGLEALRATMGISWIKPKEMTQTERRDYISAYQDLERAGVPIAKYVEVVGFSKKRRAWKKEPMRIGELSEYISEWRFQENARQTNAAPVKPAVTDAEIDRLRLLRGEAS